MVVAGGSQDDLVEQLYSDEDLANVGLQAQVLVAFLALEILLALPLAHQSCHHKTYSMAEEQENEELFCELQLVLERHVLHLLP